MTTITFRSSENHISSFTVSGHTGFAQAGQDILCAAVTSAVRLTECAVNDVLGLGVCVKVRQKDASISLKLPSALNQESQELCDTLLCALMVYFSQLQEEYPDHLCVLEVDESHRKDD